MQTECFSLLISSEIYVCGREQDRHWMHELLPSHFSSNNYIYIIIKITLNWRIWLFNNHKVLEIRIIEGLIIMNANWMFFFINQFWDMCSWPRARLALNAWIDTVTVWKIADTNCAMTFWTRISLRISNICRIHFYTTIFLFSRMTLKRGSLWKMGMERIQVSLMSRIQRKLITRRTGAWVGWSAGVFTIGYVWEFAKNSEETWVYRCRVVE
jgi:hypothetical protein